MLMNLKIAEMKLLAEVLADYLQQVGNDPDRRERIEFARRLVSRVDFRLFFALCAAGNAKEARREHPPLPRRCLAFG